MSAIAKYGQLIELEFVINAENAEDAQKQAAARLADMLDKYPDFIGVHSTMKVIWEPAPEESVWYTEDELDAELDELDAAEFEEELDEAYEDFAEAIWVDQNELRLNEDVTPIIVSYVKGETAYIQALDKVEKIMKGNKA